MAQINFYHLSLKEPEKAACKILEKCHQNNAKVLVRVMDHAKQESLNKTLWTFAQKLFIPHCSADDENIEAHPIYITTGKENPIKADMLMLIDTLDGVYEDFQRIFVMFTEASEGFKVAYHKLKTPNNIINYYTQNSKGVWEQKEI